MMTSWFNKVHYGQNAKSRSHLRSGLLAIFAIVLATSCSPEKLKFDTSDIKVDFLIQYAGSTGLVDFSGSGTEADPFQFKVAENTQDNTISLTTGNLNDASAAISCSGPKWITYEPAKLKLTIIPPSSSVGSAANFSCTIDTADQSSAPSTLFFVANVTNVNSKPTIAYLLQSSLKNFTGKGTEAEPYKFELPVSSTDGTLVFDAKDADNDIVEIKCDNAPTWIQIDSNTRRILFAPTKDQVKTTVDYNCYAFDGTDRSAETIYLSVTVSAANASSNQGGNNNNNKKDDYLLTIVAGGEQITSPGTMYPQALKVQLSKNGSAVAGESVLFGVHSGAGTLSAESMVTNTSGIATITATAGVFEGTTIVRASYGTIYVDFSLTALVIRDATVSIESGDGQAGMTGTVLADHLSVLVIDNVTSQPLPGSNVRFQVVSGNSKLDGSFGMVDVPTDVNGIAAVPLTMGSILGTHTISAKLSANPDLSVLFTETAFGPVSAGDSLVDAATIQMVADGGSSLKITVSARDVSGTQIGSGGETVVITTTAGSMIGSVVDQGDGTYVQYLQAASTPSVATISATIGGIPVVDTATVSFVTGAAGPAQSLIVPASTIVTPDGITNTVVTVILYDSNGNPLTAGGDTVTLTSTIGTWTGAIIDLGNGRYQRTLTAPGSPGVATLNGTVNGVALPSASINFINPNLAPSAALSYITVAGGNTIQAGGAPVAVTLTLISGTGFQIPSGGATVTFSPSSGTMTGSVVDNNNGTYTQMLTPGASAETGVTLTATFSGVSLVSERTQTLAYYGAIDLTKSTLSALPSAIEASGTSTTTVKITAKDVNSTRIPVGGATGFAMATTSGSFTGTITDNGDGTYQDTLTSAAAPATATITATKSAAPLTSTLNVEFFASNNLAGLTIDCTNIATYKNGAILVDAGTLVMNTRGPNGYCPSDFVFTTVLLKNNAVLTHDQTGMSVPRYGLEFTADAVFIEAGSSINVSQKGYYANFGPGANDAIASTSNVPCHGGLYSGNTSLTYGNLFAPYENGEGRSECCGRSVSGGGQIKLTIAGTLTNHGSILANGTSPTHATGNSNGGAGGSVWIDTQRIEGTGIIKARGGVAVNNASSASAGGGRIAIYYQESADNFSYPAGMIANISAASADIPGSATSKRASAGTIFLKNTATQTYGDLIINNEDGIVSDFETYLAAPAATLATALGATTWIQGGSFFAGNRTNKFIYEDYYVDPNTALDPDTHKVFGKTFYRVASGTVDQLSVVAGANMDTINDDFATKPIQLALIFDNIEIRGGSRVGASIPVIGLNGDLASNNNSTAIVKGVPPTKIEYPGADVTFDLTGIPDLTLQPEMTEFTSLYVKGDPSKTHAFRAPTVLKGGSLTFQNMTVYSNMSRGNYMIDITGQLQLINSTVYHDAASGASEGSIEIRAGSMSIDATSAVNGKGKGQPQTASNNRCTIPGGTVITSATLYNSSATIQSGGSHGGTSGLNNDGTNMPYGSFMSPYRSGATCRNNSVNTAGGGIIRLDTGGGSMVINGLVTAEAHHNSNPVDNARKGGAGGSIYLFAGALSGSGTVTANGGNEGRGGGGGRIAVYYDSLSGNFAYPNYLTNITVYGGNSNSSNADGNPGTLFMKDKAETYGDLIGHAPITLETTVASGNDVRGTYINVPSGTSSALTATVLTSSATFMEAGIETNNLVGLYVNPNTAQSTLFPIVAQSGSTITVTGDMTTVASAGDPFKIVAIVNHLHVYNTAFHAYGGGELRVMNGTLGGTAGELTIDSTDAAIKGGGYDFSNLTTVNLYKATAVPEKLPSGTTTIYDSTVTMSAAARSGNLVFDNTNATYSGGASVAGSLSFISSTSSGTGLLTVGGDLTLSGSTLTSDSLDLTPSLVVSGDMSMSSNSTLTHSAVSSAEFGQERRLYVTANNLTIDSGSKITANLKGYLESNDNSMRVYGNRSFNMDTSASIGGVMGGGVSANPASAQASASAFPSYGTFYWPVELGAGSKVINAYRGGGAIRLKVAGTFTLNGTVTADSSNTEAGANNNGRGTGSGGSILVETDLITGNGSMSATGMSSFYAPGSGGRIAIYYKQTGSGTGMEYPTSLVNNLNVQGQRWSSFGSAAGTIFLMNTDSQTYGDLIIDNRSVIVPSGVETFININPTGTIQTVLSATTFDVAGGALGYATGKNILFPNRWAGSVSPNGNSGIKTGYFVNANPDGTPTIVDDTLFQISSHTDSILTIATGGDLSAVSTDGDPYRMVLVLDNLSVRNGGRLNFAGGDIRVLSGDVFSNDTTSFSQDGWITANTVDLGPGVTWTTTANAGGTVTNQCSANFSCP